MADQVQVEILGMVITARYGSLASGTILRTDTAFAKHLVDDCRAAKYVEPPVVEPPVVEPNVVELPVVEPPVVEPNVVEPPVVEPNVVEPTKRTPKK